MSANLLDFFIRVVLAGIISTIAIIATKFMHDGYIADIYVFFIFFGSFFYFFGIYMTASGFWVRFHFIDTETPEIAWKFLGIICWSIAIICFVYNLL